MIWKRKEAPTDNALEENTKNSLHLKNRDRVLDPALGSRVGNRGQPRHPWWPGPREPPQLKPGDTSNGVVSLFVDGITRNTTISELRRLFETTGMVADVYISGKHRKNTKVSFGFVRFYKDCEATQAIKQLDGYNLHGSIIRVTIAKYQKGGKPMSTQKVTNRR